jgi:transposase
MSNIKYVGMDVHKSITVIVVLDAAGQVESRSQVKTKAENIRDFFRGMSGKVEVVFEEGTHSAWLYKLLKPLVATVTVCDPRHNKLIEDGNKSDKEICRAYDNLVEDSTRIQNRLKALYRGRGISCSGHALYRADQRLDWLAKLSEEAARFRAESLLEQLESISQLRKQAKQRLMAQARNHADYKILVKLPGFGPVRVAQLIAEVGTPHRFRTKRQFWPYCGYAVVTRSSADYQFVEGKIVKQRKKVSTRGLNVRLRQWCMTSGISKDKMSRDNSESNMIKKSASCVKSEIDGLR